MPIYDYRCDECGHRFSAVQAFSDAPLDKCPNCGKLPRRLITAPGIVFKGSGWYKTDSRPASKDGDGATASSGADKKDAKADSKSETKASDPKADAKPSAGASKSEAKS